MRLLISGGGTGGHVLPALAVAQAFRAEHPDGALLMLGRAGGLEEQLVPAAGFPFQRDLEEFETPRTVLTGYPLRPGCARRTPRVPPRSLLVMGGSQGARRLNQAVWGALDRLLARFEEVVHLTGRQGEAQA